MNLDIAELQKIYVSNKYSPTGFFHSTTGFFLNPFTEILFTSSWVWPEEFMAQKKNLKKSQPNRDNLKQKIKQWFQSLDFQSKLNYLAVKDKKFIQALRHFIPSHACKNMYNMGSLTSIEEYDVSAVNFEIQQGLNFLLQNMQIAFLKEPILHLSKNTLNFLCNELIKWMEIISHNKLFQFVNKTKQSESQHDNPLWFSEHSFQKLQAHLANQFEKAILKAYFNRDRIQSNHLQDVKLYCASLQREKPKHKNIEADLLDFSFAKAAALSEKEIFSKLKQMAQIEEKFEKQKEKIFQKLLEQQIQADTQTTKKRKRRVRRKNKVEAQSPDKKQRHESPDATLLLAKVPKFKAKQFLVEQSFSKQEQKSNFQNQDQISQISKIQDSQFHQTDVTFQKYFENEDKIVDEPQFERVNERQSQTNSVDLKKQPFQQQTKIVSESNLPQTLNQELDTSNPKETQSRQKKKSKKQKTLQNLHSNLIKSIRNNAFTQFIDTISIDSNNLYNYKLSAYQFIVFFISSLLPPTNITLFGSNAVGLSLASSDIDIMISNIRWSSISEVREVLYHIGNQISKMGWVVDFRLILNAKVPVLKLFIDPKIDYFEVSPLKYNPHTNLMQSILIKADIIVNIEGEENIGCESTVLMKQWLTDHPQLQRIILFFKYVLWYYGLNENYRGGICSYCIFLMVVSCLFKKPGKEQKDKKDILEALEDQDQGTYILQILQYYSQNFDHNTDEISLSKDLKSTTNIETKFKKQEHNFMKRNLNLKVVDPINGEYIQSSFSKFQQVQQLFSMILVETMKSDKQLNTHLSLQDQISEEFTKLYQSMSQSNTAYNIITKNMDQANQAKFKKTVKKISGKLKKSGTIKYNVKDIVSIGFKIGIQNWMTSSAGTYEQKFWA